MDRAECYTVVKVGSFRTYEVLGPMTFLAAVDGGGGGRQGGEQMTCRCVNKINNIRPFSLPNKRVSYRPVL